MLRRSSIGNARTWKRWRRRIGRPLKESRRLSIGAMRSCRKRSRSGRQPSRMPTSAEAVSKQTEAVKQGVEKAVANFRELSEMEAQARNNAWKVVQERIQENLS